MIARLHTACTHTLHPILQGTGSHAVMPLTLLCCCSGVKSLMKPLSSWYSSNSSSDHSIAQPAVAFEDLQQLPKPEPLNLTKQLRDDDRVLEGLVPAPVGALLVAPDNLGRVLLVDGASMAAVRIWKVRGDTVLLLSAM